MSEDIGRLLVSVLAEYNCSRISPAKMNELANDKKTIGLTDFNTKNIYVRNNLCRSQSDLTLLHEFAHVYYAHIGHYDIAEKVVDEMAYDYMKRLYVG